MGSIPTRFWMTLGWGIHHELPTRAYDQALYHAGLCDQNIIAVSSVPPKTQIEVPTREGISYIPVWKEGKSGLADDLLESLHVIKSDIPGAEVESDTQYYYKLPTSTCVDVVLVRMDGNSFERITSALAIGSYYMPDRTIGKFAFEAHGNKIPQGCVDNAIEGFVDMCKMRGRELVPRKLPEDTKGYYKKFKIATSSFARDNTEFEFHATKEVHYCDTLDIDVYLCTMVVPEGFCGSVLAAAVMDPFTEIHSIFYETKFQQRARRADDLEKRAKPEKSEVVR